MPKFDVSKIKFTVVKDPDKMRACMAIQYLDDENPLSIAWDISDTAYFTHDYLDRLRASLIEIQNIVENGGVPSYGQIDDKSPKSPTEKNVRRTRRAEISNA